LDDEILESNLRRIAINQLTLIHWYQSPANVGYVLLHRWVWDGLNQYALRVRLRTEKRHALAVKREASGENVARERLAVELRLLIQEGERGETDALIEIGHQARRTNELQVWFVAEHVVDAPVVGAEELNSAER
jgi:hypothetical protein